MLTTKTIAEIIDRERRIQYDKKSAYMEVLKLARQNYTGFLEYLNKDNNRASFNQIQRYLKPLGYELVIRKVQNHHQE